MFIFVLSYALECLQLLFIDRVHHTVPIFGTPYVGFGWKLVWRIYQYNILVFTLDYY